MAKTYNNLYMDIRQQLLDRDVTMASLEARTILRQVTGKDKAALIRDAHLYVSPEEERHALDMLNMRLGGAPIAHLIGAWEFYGLPLVVTPDVLIPRVDTEVLAEEAIKRAASCHCPRVLDLCTGSGCVGLAVAAHVPDARVILADISDMALKVARQNVRGLNLTSRVTTVAADALTRAPQALGRFDFLLCNPPYISADEWDELPASVRDYEPRLALDGGLDGLRFYHSLVTHWRGALAPGGVMMVECGKGQAEAVRDIFLGAAYGKISIVQDTQYIDRVVIAEPVWNEAIRDGIAYGAVGS